MVHILRSVPRATELKNYSDRIVEDALAQYRRTPDVYRVPVYDPLPDGSARGLSISVGHAVSRARHQGTMPCVGWNKTWAVVYPKMTYACGGWRVAVRQRYGDWVFPDPNAYGAQIADELRTEILREIAGEPPRLDFVDLAIFRDEVLSRRNFAGTDDRGTLDAILVHLQDLNLVKVQVVEFQGRVVQALRLTPMGWQVLEPKGEAA